MAVKSAYGASAAEIGELFGDYLQGDASCPLLVLSSQTLGDQARDALVKSMEAFGYSPDSCAYATLSPAGCTDEGSVKLDASAVFMLVEGLDPLFVVGTDSAACSVLAAAFRCDFPTDSPARAFGRPAAGFANLEQLLQTPQGKQKAWKILKSLPQ